MTVGSSGPHERVLDPVERLSEILFGLIMVLSFTCSMSAAEADRAEVRSVIGALGCNLAWGIVDAIMYLMTILLERGRSAAIGRAVREAADPARGRELLATALPSPLDRLFEGDALESARQRLVAYTPPRKRFHLGRSDFAGAFGVFLLVFLSTFPVVIPFFFVADVERALRISNVVAIVMMFVAGHRLGKFAGVRPFGLGLAMVAVGVVLVGITIALGG